MSYLKIKSPYFCWQIESNKTQQQLGRKWTDVVTAVKLEGRGSTAEGHGKYTHKHCDREPQV